jgi:alkylhydroperoxidase family enzyme
VSRYDSFVAKLKAAVTNSSGFTTPALRSAIVEDRETEMPRSMADYLAKVRRHAYRVTDADVEALKSQGLSDDEIFEITGSAALGAALHRLDRGMTALRGKKA